MNLGDLAFRLILILFPGIIATLLYRRLVIKRKWESIDIGLNTLLFGILSYLLLQLILIPFNSGELVIWQRLQDDQPIPYLEVFAASITSIFCTGLIATIVNKKLINRLANYLGISDKYGEDNLFYTFLSSRDLSEVHIKDPTNNLIYTGYVRYYSEDEDVREIVLEEVDMYEYDSAKHMNSLKSVYLNRAKTDILIMEVPKSRNNGETEENHSASDKTRQTWHKREASNSEITQDTTKTQSKAQKVEKGIKSRPLTKRDDDHPAKNSK